MASALSPAAPPHFWAVAEPPKPHRVLYHGNLGLSASKLGWIKWASASGLETSVETDGCEVAAGSTCRRWEWRLVRFDELGRSTIR